MSLLRIASHSASLRTLAAPQTTRFARHLGTSALRSNSQQPSAAAAAGGEDGEQKIVQLLTDRFKPSQLKVQDVSGGCGSFYAISIASKEFKGLSTIKAHRLVNQELKEVIKDIHGLQLRTIAEE
ncbi:hypothetical protein ACQY0O_003934 [Thecaphora frezii]